MNRKPKMRKYTKKDFDRQFPDDATCLEWLKSYLYPDGVFCEKCNRVTKHHRVASRPSYSCDYCGHHVHPTAGTIFHKSSTSLHLWFYAMYLMTSTRCGISAKQLERELGVTYKTAYRMAQLIRQRLMTQDTEPFKNGQPIEMDETYVGQRQDRKSKRVGEQAPKAVVFGMVQRKGRVAAMTVPNAKKVTLYPIFEERILPRSTVYTDTLPS